MQLSEWIADLASWKSIANFYLLILSYIPKGISLILHNFKGLVYRICFWAYSLLPIWLMKFGRLVNGVKVLLGIILIIRSILLIIALYVRMICLHNYVLNAMHVVELLNWKASYLPRWSKITKRCCCACVRQFQDWLTGVILLDVRIRSSKNAPINLAIASTYMAPGVERVSVLPALLLRLSKCWK